MKRRNFLLAAGAGPVLRARGENRRPNILWITCEDMSPHLGCYGDAYAISPNLDELAKRSLRYRVAWSNAPVCAPARTAIITGMYPPSTGSEHMRSFTKLPPSMRMFPCLLREAGYYCTNNVKEDYNLEHTGQVWDESSNRAHWRKRRPGQPFFSVFNFTVTHESQVRRRPHQLVHDPAKVRLPAYHPDTPEVRQDWAQYYDNITVMDALAGKVLRELQEDGLAEDTIVFFYSDHGAGMPRSKRWPYNSGLHVPLIIHVPERLRHLAPADYQPGGWTDRLVSFVDFAPTVLSLAGIRKPPYYQGHAFMGQFNEPEQPFLYGFRGRMDERYDMVRSVRDRHYIYIRNYMPHRVYGAHIAYMFEMPTTQKWHELYLAGKLNDAQKRFWESKPAEELYDLQADPDEVQNLAESKAHRAILERMRAAQLDLARKIKDVGYLAEAEIQTRSAGDAPYAMGHDPARYPADKVIAMADRATRKRRPPSRLLAQALQDEDSGVRMWAAIGLRISGPNAVLAHQPELERCLSDRSPAVQIAAAEALAKFAAPEAAQKAIDVLLDRANLHRHGFYVALQALNALEELRAKLQGRRAELAALPTQHESVHPRMRENIERARDHLVRSLLAER
ncbi:MAG: sulfatase [Bryobacteraceae bacterium]|nr:sulfatase [Bryobacteraceae bacterium]MDW8379418.1 sulfatase [Bryobacterales bacterium]